MRGDFGIIHGMEKFFNIAGPCFPDEQGMMLRGLLPFEVVGALTARIRHPGAFLV